MSNNNQRRFSDSIKGSYDSSNNVDLSPRTPTVPESEPSGYVAASKVKKKHKTMADKKLKITGLIFIALFTFSIFLAPNSASVNTSEKAVQAVESGISTQLPIGVRVLTDDENLAGQDFMITHSSPSNGGKVHIWDYAAEDGDYVQILVDGIAIGDPFMIKNKPIVYTVPTTGEIQVLGTRDGGGGITYAVHFEVNGTTYFNGTDVGDENLYTLIKE